jgi:hypothetical protein
MRILAHHAKDERFAFLRGRYKDAWQSLKDQNRRKKMNDPENKQKEEKAVGALLGGYESSDEDEAEDRSGEDPLPPASPPPPPPSPPPPDDSKDLLAVTTDDAQPAPGGVAPSVKGAEVDEAEKQRLRRLKVEEWKRKRAEGQTQ